MAVRFVSLLTELNQPLRVKHFKGMPPELTGGIDNREEFPRPRVLLIEHKTDGVFLFRFTEDGRPCGDTWHMSVDDAKSQALYEYGNSVSEWEEVPSHVGDPIAFALGVGH